MVKYPTSISSWLPTTVSIPLGIEAKVRGFQGIPDARLSFGDMLYLVKLGLSRRI
jgi:hypothetical protein